MSVENKAKEIIQCGKDPIYFINKYVKIQHPQRGLIPFDTYPFQNDCVKAFRENRFNIILKSRQLGLSTITAAFCAWYSIFYRDKNILIIATKQKTAANILKKIKITIQNLPSWLLLPKIEEDNKHTLRFSNGSSVQAIARSEDAARGEALSLLIIDECIAGDSKITIRNKETGEIKECSISEVWNML